MPMGMSRRLSLQFVLFLVLAGLQGCNRDAKPLVSPRDIGNAQHGASLVRSYGCGSCHTIKGIPEANGVVGPPLSNVGNRIYIAGMLRNTPDNMERWIENPQAVVPGNVMPKLGITRDESRDITAYLYTLR